MQLNLHLSRAPSVCSAQWATSAYPVPSKKIMGRVTPKSFMIMTVINLWKVVSVA